MFTFELIIRTHYLVPKITFRFLKDKWWREDLMRSIIELMFLGIFPMSYKNRLIKIGHHLELFRHNAGTEGNFI